MQELLLSRIVGIQRSVTEASYLAIGMKELRIVHFEYRRKVRHEVVQSCGMDSYYISRYMDFVPLSCYIDGLGSP